MTILDAKNYLFRWFLTKDYFCFSQYPDLVKENLIITEDEKLDRITIARTLNFLTDAQILAVHQESPKSEKTWILTRDLKTMDQSVLIDSDVAQEIAICLKLFNEMHGSPTECDPYQITNRDIDKLCKYVLLSMNTLIRGLKPKKDQNEV